VDDADGLKLATRVVGLPLVTRLTQGCFTRLR